MNKTAFAVLGSALLLAACSKSAPPEEPVRAVKVMTVGADSFDTAYEFAGEVKAQVESRLGFRVGGKIIKRQAELGQQVKAGQVLAQLDPQDYRLAADAARAQVAGSGHAARPGLGRLQTLQGTPGPELHQRRRA